MATMIMEYLSPHVIFRLGILAGNEYPNISEHLSSFLAQSLFFTSDLYLSSVAKHELVQRFSSNVLRHLTEQVIFTEPYQRDCPNNRHTPLLDDIVEQIRSDVALKMEVSKLKHQFMCEKDALLHGDAHTGSMLITREETKVFDSEFACFGPMGFEIGLLVGNMLIGYFSQPGHNNGKEYGIWILDQIIDIWNKFTTKFSTLWANNRNAGNDYALVETEEERKLVEQDYLKKVFHDTIRFSGAVIIRRILGIAHVQDFEFIEEVEARASCERDALEFAIYLLKEGKEKETIEQVLLPLTN
eukprot:TRINITY_DN3180_c0_g1_i3.p1 TRINITY_DN3180_c0_g1~~TRINITY_DN3180_c0_g1_i3.p1  ORF type:complete len:300 (+),score=53.66 TRINITY_DN3180_c0_g1_i3:203-1102(+)